MLNFCGIVVAILKMETGRNFSMSESIRDIIIYLHMKCHWNRTMLNLCGIVVTILKMATGRNFSMSGINSGHHYLPTLNLNFYCRFFMPCFGSHFENGRHLENFENAELLLRWWPIIVSKFMSLLNPPKYDLNPFYPKTENLFPTRNIYL